VNPEIMALGLLGSYLSSSSEDEDDDDVAGKTLADSKEQAKAKSTLANPFSSSIAKPAPSYALEVHVKRLLEF
jgi:hypothetical protein